MEGGEPGERIFCRTYSPTAVHTLIVKVQNNFFVADGSGSNTKLATVRSGGVRSTQPLYTTPNMGLKIISGRSTSIASQKAN
jgi:hypothetical protein